GGREVRPPLCELPSATAQLRRVGRRSSQEGKGNRSNGRRLWRMLWDCPQLSVRVSSLGSPRKGIRDLPGRSKSSVGRDRGRAAQVRDAVRKLPSGSPRRRSAARTSGQCHLDERGNRRGRGRVISPGGGITPPR